MHNQYKTRHCPALNKPSPGLFLLLWGLKREFPFIKKPGVKLVIEVHLGSLSGQEKQ